MSLNDLSNIAQVVSGVAVLASLIYLSLQIRQNTHAHRATARENRRAVGRDQLLLLGDPETAQLILRGHAADKTMTTVEHYRYNAYVTAFFVGMEEQFWLLEQGVLDDKAFAGQAVVLLGYLAQPGPRIVWHLWKPRASPAFQKFVAEHLPRLAAAPFVPFEDRWKAAEVASIAASTP